MIGRLICWWHRRQRRIDMEILWPECVAQAINLDHAKAVFAVHAFNDPAWLSLGEPELREFIDNLREDMEQCPKA